MPLASGSSVQQEVRTLATALNQLLAAVQESVPAKESFKVVIVGGVAVLAAVAIPKYISLETDAYDAQAKAAAGAIASASAPSIARASPGTAHPISIARACCADAPSVRAERDAERPGRPGAGRPPGQGRFPGCRGG